MAQAEGMERNKREANQGARQRADEVSMESLCAVALEGVA
jgi:hypothetical protein